MKETTYKWLSHLEDSIPQEAFGYTVSMYSVALEGWRRGMTLKFINNNRRKSEIDYSLTYKGKERFFCVTMGESVSKSAVGICRDKHLTKKYLSDHNVPTPEGEYFGKETDDDELLSYANSLGYPLVLKPAKGTGGRGVIANIQNESEFKEALSYVKHDLNTSELIIEKYFAGEDYRVYVMEDKVLAVLDRISANVIGDGLKTVNELLIDKNKERNKSPAFYNRSIKIDKEMHQMLKLNGYTLQSIPEKGERVYLKSKNNISAGGDPIDITEELSPEIKNIAVRAVEAIPGITHGGVDIIVDKNRSSGVVLEVNSRPSITGHLFPMEGKARNIPKEIIDHYFPETQANYEQPLYYFDFKHVYELFLNRSAKEFTIPDVPKGPLEATRFVITGNFSKRNYENWVRKHANKLDLHGYIKRLERNKISLVVSGSLSSVNKLREVINNNVPPNNKVESIIEKSRKTPIKIGFKIIVPEEFKRDTEIKLINKSLPEGYHPVHLEDPHKKEKQKVRKSKKKHTPTAQRKVAPYKKKYEDIINSKSWRLTKPLRKIGSTIRNIKSR